MRPLGLFPQFAPTATIDPSDDTLTDAPKWQSPFSAYILLPTFFQLGPSYSYTVTEPKPDVLSRSLPTTIKYPSDESAIFIPCPFPVPDISKPNWFHDVPLYLYIFKTLKSLLLTAKVRPSDEIVIPPSPVVAPAVGTISSPT